MKKILAILAMAISGSVYAASATIEYQDQTGVNGTTDSSLYLLSVSENINKNFSAGISEALITTAEGLIVAIPVLVVHGLLKSLAKGKFGEVEGVGIALINGTTERERHEGIKPSGKNDPSSHADDSDDDLSLSPNLV